MNNERQYTILLDPDEEDGGYPVTVPALPGVVTQGETIEECQAQAREAITLHTEGLLAGGMEVPEEHTLPQLIAVSVAA